MADKKSISPDDMSALYKVAVESMSKIRDDKNFLKMMTPMGLLISVVLIIGVAISFFHFYFTHEIGVLMLMLSCAVIVCCFGLCEMSKNMAMVQKEYAEYDNAVHALFNTLMEAPEDLPDALITILASAIVDCSVNNSYETIEDAYDVTIGDLRSAPCFGQAFAFATRLQRIYGLYASMEKESGDVLQLLSSIDFSDLQSAEDLLSTYTSGCSSTDISASEENATEVTEGPVEIATSECQHIIPIVNGGIEEDTSIIV